MICIKVDINCRFESNVKREKSKNVKLHEKQSDRYFNRKFRIGINAIITFTSSA